MITLRTSCQRGYADHGWLRSYHSFSFANYFDPEHMGFGNLRVINEDFIAPGTGFGTHGHRDMEIISVVLEGALAHKDSMGHGATIVPGEVQRMSAGHGVLHSEFNHDEQQPTHLLQIWIEPQQRGIPPSYEQRRFAVEAQQGRLQLVAAPIGEAADALSLHADARLYLGRLTGDGVASLVLDPARLAYVHLISGRVRVNGVALSPGDAAKLIDEPHLRLDQAQDAQVIVFDLAP